MKTIEQIYKEIQTKQKDAVGVLFHGYNPELTENKELDAWIRVTDRGYPVSSKDILGPNSHEHEFEHNDWMHDQHNHDLKQKHMSSLTPTDIENIGKVIKGGFDFGHGSGSSDITKHLVAMHGKGNSPPTHFTRVPQPNSRRKEAETIDLRGIDSAIKKNKFDSEFHSFHGVGFDPSKVVGDDKLLRLPAYTSGSVNRNIALKYADFQPASYRAHHIIHLINPPKSTGVYIGNDDFVDNEVLLPRNMTIKLHSTYPTEYQVGNKNVKVWVASRQSHMET